MFYILDPHITLTHTDLLARNDLVIVNCTVDEPAGEPFFSLRYKGTESTLTLIGRYAVRNPSLHHRWMYSTIMPVPDEGMIICDVTDMFGRYRVQKYIRIAGMLFIAKNTVD